jgi:c-di-GMP-binding flagellar brake protein YcgR
MGKKEEVKFQLNNKIEVLWEDGNYKSVIQDITNNSIGINIPVCGGKYLPLRKGEWIEAICFSKNSIYKFNTVVLGRKIDGMLIIMLAKPKKFTRIQRRNHVRIPVLLNITCGALKLNKDLNEIDDNQCEFFQAYSLDLSGGGMKIASDKKISLGDILLITLPLGKELLAIKGKVVRGYKDVDSKKNIYGVCFFDIEQGVRENIIQFIFRIMRERRRKGVRGE